MRRAATVLLAGVLVAACSAIGLEPIDFSQSPGIVNGKRGVVGGDEYTFGVISRGSLLNERVTLIEAVEMSGLRVLGYGVRATAGDGAIGIATGWPPNGHRVDAIGDAIWSRVWNDAIEVFIGVELTEPVGGLRGVRTTLVDPSGRATGSVNDWGFVLCVDECDSQDALRQLGLSRQ